MNPQDVLALPMQDNQAGAATIRDYLVALLRAVWVEGEGFSGKRPFGDSGWEWDLYEPLVKSGFIGGKLDENGFIDDCDKGAGRKLIREAIEALGAEQRTTALTTTPEEFS